MSTEWAPQEIELNQNYIKPENWGIKECAVHHGKSAYVG